MFFLCVATRLFRTMALRHLIVVNNLHEPVGMISRKDIMYSKLHRYFLENVRYFVIGAANISLNTNYYL